MSTQFSFRISMFVLVMLLSVTFALAQNTKEDKKETTDQASEATITPAFSGKPAPADESKSWATLGRLYVVIATDDNWGEVPGQTAAKNGEKIESLFKSYIAPGAFAVIKIPADQITRQTIFSVLSNLPLKSQDAVCLYLSGKGKVDRKYGAFFELSKGKEELYRSELRAALAKKNCRLSVLISDLCDGKKIPVKPELKPETTSNSEAESKPATDSNTEPKELVTVTEDKKKTETESTAKPVEATSTLFFTLFFQSTGVVDIISATPNQLSLPSDQGIGCFTEAFTGLLSANKNKSLTWYRFFPYISRGTGLVFEGIYADGADITDGMKQASQTPIILTLGQDNLSPDTFTTIYSYGNEFDKPIPSVTDNEVALTEEGRKIISQLIQVTFGTIRPQNDQEKGTHEDYAAFELDNTVNGSDGNPFSTTLPSVKPIHTETTVTTVTNTTAVSGMPKKLGVRAADNKGDGVLITQVLPGYPGIKAGLVVGDVILTIDGKKITSEKEYSDAIDAAGNELKLNIRNKTGGTSVVIIPFFIQQ